MKLTLKEIDHMDHLAEETMKIYLHGRLNSGKVFLSSEDCPLLAEQSYDVATAMMRARRQALDRIRHGNGKP